jgi:hypothetical protein
MAPIPGSPAVGQEALVSADFDLESTLVRRGRAAVTVADMKTFALMLEHRPLAMLLGELPALARLSESKFNLATNILRRRFRGEAPIDRLQLRCIADEIAATVDGSVVAGRIRALFR